MAKMVLLKCQNCDSKNEVKLHQQGSFGIEVAIWILTCFTLGWILTCFTLGWIYSIWRYMGKVAIWILTCFTLGWIYSIWRYMGKVAICPSCGKATKWA
jgi:hypothetical protein